MDMLEIEKAIGFLGEEKGNPLRNYINLLQSRSKLANDEIIRLKSGLFTVYDLGLQAANMLPRGDKEVKMRLSEAYAKALLGGDYVE